MDYIILITSLIYNRRFGFGLCRMIQKKRRAFGASGPSPRIHAMVLHCSNIVAAAVVSGTENNRILYMYFVHVFVSFERVEIQFSMGWGDSH